MAELNEAISAFHNIVLCAGILDPTVMKVKDITSGIRKKNCWRSKDCCFVVPKTTRYLLQMVPYDKAFEHENYGQNDWKEGFSENSAELCYTTLFLNLTNLVPIDVEFVLVCFVIVEIQVCFLA